MDLVRWLKTTTLLVSATVAGCGGGDLCSSDLSAVAGTWDLRFASGTDSGEVATVVIDDAGNVTVSSPGNDVWECDLLQSDLCDLQIKCTDTAHGDSFTLGLTRH